MASHFPYRPENRECHVKENPDKKAKKKQRIQKSFKNSNICKRATTLEQTI